MWRCLEGLEACSWEFGRFWGCGGGGGRGDGGVVRGGGDEGVGGEVLGKKRREEALCRDLVVVGAREVGVQFVLFVLLRLGERER